MNFIKRIITNLAEYRRKRRYNHIVAQLDEWFDHNLDTWISPNDLVRKIHGSKRNERKFNILMLYCVELEGRAQNNILERSMVLVNPDYDMASAQYFDKIEDITKEDCKGKEMLVVFRKKSPDPIRGELDVRTNIVTMTPCPACEGMGMDKKQQACTHCKGKSWT